MRSGGRHYFQAVFFLLLVLPFSPNVLGQDVAQLKVITSNGLIRAMSPIEDRNTVTISVSGAAMPVTLTLINVDGIEVERSASGDSQGRFVFRDLKPGTWKITDTAVIISDVKITSE